MRTSNLQIPTVENVNGKLSVKFSTKTYPEFLKDNTQTNLRSVDLGDGNYSYTVQRNIVFTTPKVEKIKQLKVNPIIENVVATTEDKKINEFKNLLIGKKVSVGNLINRAPEAFIVTDVAIREDRMFGSAIKVGLKDIRSGNVQYMRIGDITKTSPEGIEIENINKKYDLNEIVLESQQKPDVHEKPKLQQRRGNGKSIERKKPLSDEDLMPNFNEVAEESSEFKTKPKANTLQMDFITFAKMQEPEIKRSLIAMNRNKEIEVKCK